MLIWFLLRIFKHIKVYLVLVGSAGVFRGAKTHGFQIFMGGCGL